MVKKSEEKNLPKVLNGTIYVNRSYHYLSEIAHTDNEDTKKKLKVAAAKSLLVSLARLEAELEYYKEATGKTFATLKIDLDKLNENQKGLISDEKGKVTEKIKQLTNPEPQQNNGSKDESNKEDYSNLY